MAIAAFRACDCAGLARVDFLMEPGAGSGHRGAANLRERDQHAYLVLRRSVCIRGYGPLLVWHIRS
jgi:hypothetical protein